MDKHNVRNQRLFRDKNVFYNYLFSFLIKNTLITATEDINILFDNHTTKVKSINSLTDYIKIKAHEWNCLRNITIEYIDSKNSKCVQMTDLVANCIFRKYNRNKSDLYNLLEINEPIKFPVGNFGV